MKRMKVIVKLTRLKLRDNNPKLKRIMKKGLKGDRFFIPYKDVDGSPLPEERVRYYFSAFVSFAKRHEGDMKFYVPEKLKVQFASVLNSVYLNNIR